MRKYVNIQLFTAAIALAALVHGNNASAANLAINPSFEEGTDAAGIPAHWTKTAPPGGITFSIDDKSAYDGTHSVTIETTGDLNATLTSDAVPAAPGEVLIISCYVRANSISTKSAGSLVLSAGFQGRDHQFFRWQRKSIAPPGPDQEWLRLHTDVTVPQGAAYVALQVGIKQMTGRIWIDAAEISTSRTHVLRLDTPVVEKTVEFEPGKIGVPAILINRPEKSAGGKLRIRTQPGGQVTELDAGSSAETSIALVFNLEKRGPVTLRAMLQDPGSNAKDFETSVTGTVRPLLFTEPLAPTHWLIEDDRLPEFESRFWVHETPELRPRISASCKLLDAAGKTVGEWNLPPGSITSAAPVTFTMQLSAKVTAPQKYTARLSLERDGKTVAEEDLPWKMIHREKATVTLADDGYLRVNGRPFFPIGLYMAARFGECADAGFNTVQQYGLFSTHPEENPDNAAIMKFLDQAEAAGMKVLLFVNHGMQMRIGREESLRRIHMFRNHPAVLVWYEEEALARGIRDMDWLKQLTDDMRREGPGHPVLLGDTRGPTMNMTDFHDHLASELMDIGTWWWYPVPPRQAPIHNDYEGSDAGPDWEYAPPVFLSNAKVKKPLWVCLQCYKKPGVPDARYPTPEEYRCQAYIAITSGAKGLFYYTALNEGKGGVLHHPSEGHWDYLKKLVSELRDMSPVFMSPDAKEQATCDNKMISLLSKDMGNGKRIILAVNRCIRPIDVKLQIPGRTASFASTIRYENRTLSVTNGELHDEFGPYEVHIYELGQ